MCLIIYKILIMNCLRIIISINLLFFFTSNALFSQEPFSAEIRLFEQTDATTPPVLGQIMLYGSSTFRLWKTAKEDCAYKDLKVVNRGFGGSQTVDANRYFERVVVPHQPSYLFFYEGDNDLNAGKSVDSIVMEMRIFIQKVREKLPNTRLIIISAKPSPARLSLLVKQKQLNKAFRNLRCRQRNIYYLDTMTPMLDATGKPKTDIYIDDNLHMNNKGYVIWTALVQSFLKKHVK